MQQPAAVSGAVLQPDASALFKLAGLGRRFVARFIDGVIVLLIDAAFGVPAVLLDGTSLDALSVVFATLFLVSLVLSGPLYETLLIGRYGQTVGKRALGIKVTFDAPSPPHLYASVPWTMFRSGEDADGDRSDLL